MIVCQILKRGMQDGYDMADGEKGVKGRNEARAQVRELIEAGHSLSKIALDTGIPYGTVARWVRERSWKPPFKLSPRAERRLRRMAETGWGFGTSANAMGRDRKVLKKLG